MKKSLILKLNGLDKTKINSVGGKAANLGELMRIDHIAVPDGFCVSTDVFRKAVSEMQRVQELLDRLSHVGVQEHDIIRELSRAIRDVIEGASITPEIEEEIKSHLSVFGELLPYAVRSSATAEDLPSTSFAGQQDTYLNVIGINSILHHIRKCWASLFTERAIVYRIQNDFDHRRVHLAVIVQKMVFPLAAGICFTADPVTSSRKVLSIDAGFGLGEALVSGLVNPDIYKVRGGEVIEKKIASKKLAIHPRSNGGTQHDEISIEKQDIPVLSDDQILTLGQIGRKIESHFGCPQDIEWCLADGTFYIVQSRPITTLFPIPKENDSSNRIYVSVGHQQMMTDAMKPLGLSFALLMTAAHMREAGGRLFVDMTPHLASPTSRDTIIEFLGKSDPLMKDALTTVIERGDFIKLPEEQKKAESSANEKGTLHVNFKAQIEYDPAIVPELIQNSERSIDELKRDIINKSGIDLFDFILQHIQKLKKLTLETRSLDVIMTGMNASLWVNEKMFDWLGEKNMADTLSQSVPNNVTSEMGLSLLDVADVVRPYPEVIEYLERVKDNDFLDKLSELKGGTETRNAIISYLDRYGMRCAGEIDITRDRWSEKPLTLVPLILNNIKSFGPNAGTQKFERGRQEALNKEKEILGRLRELPDGNEKAQETKRMIDLIRNYSGYREYPKYGMVSHYFIYKQALLREADRLVQEGVIPDREDIYYLTFNELREAATSGEIDYEIINSRKAEHKVYEKLTPPRVITSDGESISGKYKREDLPASAIAGLAVSSGIIEGRARVILKIEDAIIDEGDILVTRFTDPSWTPLFVSVKGLVTEVGGLMTHGAVIAREYGLPAVVGVDMATTLIEDGQRIRVNGTQGYIELL